MSFTAIFARLRRERHHGNVRAGHNPELRACRARYIQALWCVACRVLVTFTAISGAAFPSRWTGRRLIDRLRSFIYSHSQRRLL
ncbi:MAG: hypothetical protein LBQ57_08490 [Spirochaetales bacterium]|nr:hypothetical protein [Spirochaetales bacterium]